MGTQLIDPSGTYQYEVAAACSGIRSLIAIFLLATIYGFFVFRSPGKRFFLMALAVPFAVLGNLARMLFIIIAAEIGGQHGAITFMKATLHFQPGSLSLPAIIGMLVVGHWMEKRQEPRARQETSMKHQKWLILFVVLALMAGTAGALTWLKATPTARQTGHHSDPHSRQRDDEN